MTINTKYTISGVAVTDALQCTVNKKLGDTNASSSFNITLANDSGEIGSKYTVGEEVIIYSNLDTIPPTTKIFAGILENVSHRGKGINEKIIIDGRDYTARLMDRTVEPEVYNNLPAGSIVNDIITKYVDDITTTNTASGVNIDRIVFNQIPVFDAIKQLANTSDFTFYVDEDKDLHFKNKSATSSGKIFYSGNILQADFKERRDGIYNQVWVYGDRYLDGFKETFTGVAGSTYTLLYRPHNTDISISGTIPAVLQPGGVYQMTYGIGSDIKYLVNYEDKQIILTSGTEQGNNLYIGSTIDISYKRALPIVKVGNNQESIARYGKRVKVIQDKNIKDPISAETILLRELEEFSDPLKEGNITVKDIANITPGETCIVDIPFHNISNKTYDILEARYNFTKQNCLADSVLNIKVNKKIPDITDTLKDIMLQIKKIQGADVSDSDLITRYELATGSTGVRQSGLEIYTNTITQSGLYCYWDGGDSTITGTLASGTLQKGVFDDGTSVGSPFTELAVSWSGGYF